jgi:tetratricopeptide (TPR) repeat protein
MRQICTIIGLGLVLTGCQNMPDYGWPTQTSTKTVTKPQVVYKPTSIPIEKAKPPITPSEPTPKPVVASSPVIMKPVTPPQPVKQLADGRNMPAVQNLLASANQSLQQGNFEEAAVSLERAQRLAPQSATVYQKLAEVRLQQTRFSEAEQLARKGLSYAQGNAQQAALWRLVAQAAQEQGKTETAINAKNKAMQLEMMGDRG